MTQQSDLATIREAITTVDQELLQLLAKRRELSLAVAQDKIKTMKPVRDKAREQSLLQNLVQKGQAMSLDPTYVTQIFHTIIDDSVRFQQDYIRQITQPTDQAPMAKVAFLGAKGSYSHLAARRYFQRQNTDVLEISCDHFKGIIEQVESGQADFGVLPIENTSSGSINEVYDQLQHTSLSIVGELTLAIEHAILTAVETELSQIDTLYSHPQPHQQCSEFIHSLGSIQLATTASTAEAMQVVRDLASPTKAAIGNATSGAMYGLTAIASGIANQTENFTRFIVVARQSIDVTPLIPSKTTLIMSTSQQPGALADALVVLKNHHINMTKLESRPVMGNPWEELFYLDVLANANTPEMQSALSDLKKITRFIKVLGCYPLDHVAPTPVDGV
ncbi:Bifunctional chorismate mutase/prephenate dehydratase [Vibrio stylophorae]|uniref:Bifunctional chorismate mutase/prephenate dehydratase n=1 Tax=Vibrio stylophorae TaxID=659351 RepID=A0ABN8DUM7_9VIBR|nr:prephenate dehydratase [Vibrio stylophorae]CAH0534308.1 Bifunctional chorismate mutase/prephenate dehydratase [Vibrio stylophorae]